MALDVIEGKLGMLELSPPVTFEPVGPVTTVFFDDKNQQVLLQSTWISPQNVLPGVLSPVWWSHGGQHKVSSRRASNQPGIKWILS